MRFHLMNRVTVGEELRFGVTIDPARRIEGKARMIWTDATGKAGGMAITEMSPESRATMFSWLTDIDSPVQAAPASQAPQAARPPSPQTGISEPDQSVPAVAPPTPTAPPVASPPVVQPPAVTPSSAAPPPPAAVEPPPSFVPPPPDKARPAPPVPPVSPAANPSADTPPLASTPPAPAPPAAPPPPVAQQAAPLPEISTSLFYGIDTDLSRDPGPAPQSLVSHEDWKRAAREMDVEERTSRSPRTTALEERPAPPPRRESRKYSELADQVDPMREFLKSPLGAIPEPHRGLEARLEEHELPLPVQTNQPRAVSKSRVGMVLLLAIVCGLGVAYAGVVYRQPLGRLIISLGQMIAGEESSAFPPGEPSSGATQNPSAAPGTPGTSAVGGSAPSQTSAPAQPSGVPVIPPDGKASTANSTDPLAQVPTANRAGAVPPSGTQQPPTPRPELTSGGKEIVSGKPRRLPDDVASLWQAVENGDAVAEVALANHYAAGAGVEKNCAQARVLLEAAAKRGNEAATKRLIQLRSSGCQ
jgi:hypothetical protein